MRVSVKQTVSWLLAVALVLPGAMILSQPLEAGAAETSTPADSIPAQPVKVPTGETTENFIKNPAQPDIYTLRNVYEVTRVGNKENNYQPYVATVGADATDAEKKKVNKTITLPDFAGYDKPKDGGNTIEKYDITYQGIVDAAKAGEQSGDPEQGIAHNALKEYLYQGASGSIQVRHVFQDLKDFSSYGKLPGKTDDIIITKTGKVGDLVPIEPLDPTPAGFVPENTDMKVVIAKDSIIVDQRYNLAHFDVTYDTVDGTPVPARTLYYGQVIPPLADSDIPTKIGATLVGWKPSVDLTGTVDGTKKTFPAGQLMKGVSGNPIKDLNAELILPASNVKFTAVWEDRPRADYAIQFWTEKSDHDADASLVDKYEFVSTRVYKNQPTGTRPNLAAEPVNNVVFPDLDQARLNKIWSGATFGPFLYLNKFYTYNKDLTNSENADPRDSTQVKPVSATGKTVYNIYFDRQVYDLYFTKSNSTNDTFYPEIWRHQKQLGWPGHPYHFKARFNQRLLDWPNDALETKGFTGDKQSFGWTPNYTSKSFEYRDTPPYRLTAEEFLDMKYYTECGGYTSEIDAGDGVTIKANRKATPQTFTTLSFGIWESGSRDPNGQAVPHHMDFWMDGFDENPNWHAGMDPKEQYKKIIDYDLYRNKADTGSPSYKHPAPVVQGFTPYEGHVKSIPLDEDQLKAMNDERAGIKEFPTETVESPYTYGDSHPKGYMPFMHTFFNRADPEFGDPEDPNDPGFDTNGYIQFYYKRNTYKLRFNNDPATIKADTDYADNQQTDIFYKKPLKDLNLNDVNSLSSLGLDGLLETDSDGKTRIKRPSGLAPDMVFKGWALDPAGLKMVSTSDETMPAHALVLYAIWAEPDFKWKVTFDPDGGTLPDISETTVTQQRKTISEGDAGQGQKVTYPLKEANEGDKQVFTVLHRQKLVELQGNAKPTKEGYTFSGWEFLHYKKDANGYTDEVDDTYRQVHGVPELYGFGNDVVDPIYLKAIWVPNSLENVTVYHHFLDKGYHIDKTVNPNPKSRIIKNQRTGQFVRTSAVQNDKWRLASHDELVNSPDQELHRIYDEYNGRLGFDNNYFQMIKVEPKKITKNGQLVDNPNYKNNVFHFFYTPFRTRNYKVNYVDERAKAELAQTNDPAEKQKIIDKYRILDQERVESEARHYDARNYKPIKGWKLTSDPQQQLFYDVDEATNKFLGINGTGSDEITFFYKDVRILQVPSTGTTPEGYVRVTFKASDGGSFTDKDGNSVKELTYDVVEGTKSDQLPVPQELPSSASRADGKYYVTPEQNYSFARWDNNILLPAGTVLKKADENTYVFTAKFEKPPIVVTDGVVTTESFTDPAGTWTNDFAPTLEALKGSIKLKEDGVRKDLPDGTIVELFDEHGSGITTADAIYELVKENGKSDTEEPVRIIKLKAKVTFKDHTTRELTVPIRVYKNRYEATPSGDMPDELGRATTEPNGDLVNLLKDTTAKNYVKVTVNPTYKLRHQKPKTYWVNPKAWVDIPEIEIDPSEKAASGFKHWTADQIAQNENKAAGGVYDFAKRHKFIAETTITPIFPETPGPNPPGPNPPGPNPPGPNPPGPNPPGP
ncbi:InlB B-repeat-containing protein, partial [uncultured Mobiluncus sp.]|uniref:InlB B-repeat-containing protein n=1 Tax=uncultured Mobiluncus sp. TaxID=293425 RepID=UPI00262C8FEA